jgi:rRNA maturation RNase YbeY
VKAIYFHFTDKKIRIPNATQVKQLISLVFTKEKKSYLRIDYVFCSDRSLLRLNQRFLNHNYFTDIITFNLNEEILPVVGEIYISLDRVRANSKRFNYPFKTELLRVIIHGALHLCGYTDETKSEQVNMRKLEDKYLNAFNVSRETNF